MTDTFDINCTACPRLSVFLTELRDKYPDYHNLPVAPFGDPQAQLFIVGLAPGMHGANASGRPFTGDQAGVLLYQTLYKYGFASMPESSSVEDGLKLINCRISNAVKCLPPQNKPVGSEINTCNHFIKAEMDSLEQGAVILALGSIAHNAVLRAFGLKLSLYKFGHNILYELPQGYYLLDTYHCSRYNVNTRRLTPEMFEAVFERVRVLLA